MIQNIWLQTSLALCNSLWSSCYEAKFIVNFSDAVARIDQIERAPLIVHFGDRGTLDVSSYGRLNPLLLKSVILRPFNGWAWLHNSTFNKLVKPDTGFSLEKDGYNSSAIQGKLKSSSYNEFGPMTSRGFYQLSNSGNFFELKTHFIRGSKLPQRLLFFQDIAEGNEWNFIQMFEWEKNFFACFETSNKTLVVIRFKSDIDYAYDYKKLGTYISSFFFDIGSDPSVYFLPSYQEPIMYFSMDGKNGSKVYHALKLKKAIEKSDEGFQKCDNGNGRFPDNFLKLQPYMLNLSREFWSADETGKCATEISIFRFDEFSACFQLGPDVEESSIDTYIVGLNFESKILAYTEKGYDFRCDLSKCGTSMAPCKREKIELPKGKFSPPYWDFDTFALIRWSIEPEERKLFRLLDCEYFQSCSICILYGSFGCEWDSSSCVRKKTNSSGIAYDICYSNVTAYKRIIENDQILLTIKLSHQLNSKAGEEASIEFAEEIHSSIRYDQGVYKINLKNSNSNSSDGALIIKRGAYTMITSLIILPEPENGLTLIIALIILAIILIALIVGAAVNIRRHSKDVTDKPKSSDMSPSSPGSLVEGISPSSIADPSTQAASRSKTPSSRPSAGSRVGSTATGPLSSGVVKGNRLRKGSGNLSDFGH